MTDRAKQSIRNYIEDIGGIKVIMRRDRMKYARAIIKLLNDLEESGLYDKMHILYRYEISLKPFIFVK
jgi:hypothetical protein